MPTRRLAPGRAGRQAAAVAPVGYLEAIAAAGGIEMMVACRPAITDDDADALVGHAHGMLLLGGSDVDPARYGEPSHPQTYGVDAGQDHFELALLRAALRMGRPVLAICRGLQLVNVAFGGTLEQHLGDVEGRLAHAPASFPAAEAGSIGALLPVAIEAGCRLHGLFGALEVTGAHSHHQAVGRLGDQLRVVGRSADGVVEALEHPSHWLVAVQWHPEDTFGQDPAMARLFSGLVAEAARHLGS